MTLASGDTVFLHALHRACARQYRVVVVVFFSVVQKKVEFSCKTCIKSYTTLLPQRIFFLSGRGRGEILSSLTLVSGSSGTKT